MIKKIETLPLPVTGTAKSLALLRIFIFAIWFFYVAIDPIEDLAYLPFSADGFVSFFKIMPASFIKGILTEPFLHTFRYVTLFFLLLTIVGVFTRSAAFISCGLLLFHLGLVKCFSHLQHAELPLLYAAIVIAVFPSADAFTLERRQHNFKRSPQDYSMALFFIMFILCMAYFEVGVYRLLRGGIRIFTGDSMKFWTVLYAFKDQDYSFNFASFFLRYPVLFSFVKIGFAVITLLEILAPVALVSKKFRYFFIVSMLLFHVVVFLTMKINFGGMSLLYVVFLDLDRLVNKLSRKVSLTTNDLQTERQEAFVNI